MPTQAGRAVAFTATILILSACRGATPASAPGRGPAPSAAPDAGARRVTPAGPEFDQAKLYQDMGFLARGAPMPFIGTISFLAAPSKDSTHALFAVSMTNAALTFARENDRFRAGYSISIFIKDGGATVAQSEAHESVLVASYKETSRIDESIIYQDLLTVKPGRYTLSVTVRDDGSSRSATEDVALIVPTLGVGAGTISTPIAFTRVSPRISVDSLPRLVANPQSAAVFGRDSVVGVYVEAYDNGTQARLPLNVTVTADRGSRLFSDTLSLPRRGSLYSGVVYLAVSRVGIGPATVAFSRLGTADSVKAVVFISFGDDLPVASYQDMVDYLRWFANPVRLKALRDTAPEMRAGAWAAFLKTSASAVAGNDPLREYFRRLLDANTRFHEEGSPGWKTDRGKVLLGLGDPDAVFEQQPRAGDMGQRGRTQIWEYRGLNVQLTFYDQSGFGRWRLTNSSELEFTAAWRRRVQ
ncbi:MAG: GWxTD domain-containing protein [Gemmatimonadetes bacterium]|nr:GWxTD domain-containing protein [Gemmatimonadota bacterium]